MFFSLNSSSLRIITQLVFPKIIILYLPLIKLQKSKYRITIRAPKLWNIILNIEKPDIFKATIKPKLVLLENAILYFWCIYKTLSSIRRIFLNKKLEICPERLTSNLMLRPIRLSASCFPVSLLILPYSREISIWRL